MTGTHFAEGQILFREGDRADSVFRVLSGVVDVLRELDGDPILLGTVRAGQFIGEMGVVENRPRSATARAASEVEVEILTPTEFFDQIADAPPLRTELWRAPAPIRSRHSPISPGAKVGKRRAIGPGPKQLVGSLSGCRGRMFDPTSTTSSRRR